MKWLIVTAATAILAMLWFWRERRKRPDEPPAGIVLLLKKAKPVDVHVLAEILGKAAGRHIRAVERRGDGTGQDEEPAGDIVMGALPHFVAIVDGITYVLNSVPAPYVADPEKASQSIREMRLQKAVKEHVAWLSADILNPRDANLQTYRVIARVLANFVDDDCLALYHPPLNRFVPCNVESVIEGLNADYPIRSVFEQIAEAPVIPVEDDPRLAAAEAEARRRFSEFQTAFERDDGAGFSVKARISGGGNSEHIWVEVDRISAG